MAQRLRCRNDTPRAFNCVPLGVFLHRQQQKRHSPLKLGAVVRWNLHRGLPGKLLLRAHNLSPRGSSNKDGPETNPLPKSKHDGRLPNVVGPTVVQSTVFQIIGAIASYHLSTGAYDGLWEDPVFRDWWSAIGNQTSPGQSATTAADITTSANNDTAMALFHTTSTSSSRSSYTIPETDPEFLDGWLVPKQILSTLLTSALLYLRAVALERAFLTRPRGVEGGGDANPKREKVVVVELSEEHEEEVVKRWIARGRVRRASVSWRNTLVKWLLEVTVRAALDDMLWVLLMALMDGKTWNTSGEFWGNIFQVSSSPELGRWALLLCPEINK